MTTHHEKQEINLTEFKIGKVELQQTEETQLTWKGEHCKFIEYNQN